MLYVDMEVNGVPLKVEIWQPEYNLFSVYHLFSIFLGSSVRIEICFCALLKSSLCSKPIFDTISRLSLIVVHSRQLYPRVVLRNAGNS